MDKPKITVAVLMMLREGPMSAPQMAGIINTHGRFQILREHWSKPITADQVYAAMSTLRQGPKPLIEPVGGQVGKKHAYHLTRHGREHVRGAPHNPLVVEQVNHPAHYGGADNPYEAIKVIEAWGLPFNTGNTVKYISRAGKKDPAKHLEDLKKARWYLDREIGNLEKINVNYDFSSRQD